MAGFFFSLSLLSLSLLLSTVRIHFLNCNERHIMLYSHEEVSFICHQGCTCTSELNSNRSGTQVRKQVHCYIVFQDIWTTVCPLTISMHPKESSSSKTCLWQPLKMAHIAVRGLPFPPVQDGFCMCCLGHHMLCKVCKRTYSTTDKIYPEILSLTYKFAEKEREMFGFG